MAVWSRIALVLALSVLCAAPARAQPPDLAVVLFDQSVSQRRLEPRLAAEAMEAAARLPGIRTLTVGGFDEEVTWYLRAESPSSPAARKARERLRKLAPRERNADFEPVFRHLAEAVDPARVKVAVLISHGQPQIWDQRLSPMIKADARYQDFNDQYRDLMGAQATKAELRDYLSPFYRERNARLTDAALTRLRQVLGARLIVWDVSGRSESLKAWSASAGARLLAEPAAGPGLPAPFKTLLAAEQRQLATVAREKPPPVPQPKPAQASKPAPRPWEKGAPPDHGPRPPPGKPAPRDRVDVADLPKGKAAKAPPPPAPPPAADPEPPPAASPFPDLAALAVALGLLAAGWWWRHRETPGKESETSG